MIKRGTALLAAAAVLLGLGLGGCRARKKRFEAEFLELFDTVTKIVGYADSKAEFTRFSQRVYDELKTYHELYDIYDDYEGVSNIKTINDAAGKEPVKVDAKIITMLQTAKRICEQTDGRMNVAMGSVLSIWHDYREAGINDPDNAQLPPMADLQEAAKHTDIEKVVIDEANSTVFLEDPAMSLDVGSIGKGYATEQVCETLEKEGYTNALLSVGGNVRAIGPRADGTPWNVGVTDPADENAENGDGMLCHVRLDDASLVTSGNYERYYTVDGVRYHHLIDPSTLMPSRYFTAVTILTHDSGLADGLTTVLYNMSYEDGLKLLDSYPGTGALWVMADGSLKMSPFFEQALMDS